MLVENKHFFQLQEMVKSKVGFWFIIFNMESSDQIKKRL